MQGLESTFETNRKEVDLALVDREIALRLALASDLIQFVRRLRQYRNESEWISAVLDTARKFAGQVAMLTLKDGHLNLRGEYNFHLPPDLSIPILPAGAFAAAIESKEPVIALRTPAEVTAAFAGHDPLRAQIVPIGNGPRIVAVLLAVAQSEADFQFLELIAEIASAALERQSNAQIHMQIAPLKAPIIETGAAQSGLPEWTELSSEQRSLHIRAQRFSRVKMAEMRLSRPEAFRAGLQQANVYLYLKAEIDRARETFRKDFVMIPSMVDYLHMELVRTAAAGDEMKLGADYPGRLT